MNANTIKLIFIVTSMAWNVELLAASMSKADYETHQARISSEQKLGKEACNAMAGNARDICIADINGKQRIALAELDWQYKPSAKRKSQILVTKAEAEYAVANERCDDLTANAKDVCVKEAKAAEAAAKADAKAEMKASEATREADDKSTAAQNKARREGSEARQDAAEEKRDTRYEVAKEKCDRFSGDAKDACAEKAKVNFGK